MKDIFTQNNPLYRWQKVEVVLWSFLLSYLSSFYLWCHMRQSNKSTQIWKTSRTKRLTSRTNQLISCGKKFVKKGRIWKTVWTNVYFLYCFCFTCQNYLQPGYVCQYCKGGEQTQMPLVIWGIYKVHSMTWQLWEMICVIVNIWNSLLISMWYIIRYYRLITQEDRINISLLIIGLVFCSILDCSPTKRTI